MSASSRLPPIGILDGSSHGTPHSLTPADAPERSRQLLQGYLELSRAIKRVKLPRSLSEKISLAVQEWLGCALCLAAHADATRDAGLEPARVASTG